MPGGAPILPYLPPDPKSLKTPSDMVPGMPPRGLTLPLCPQGARCPRRACSCTGPSPANPSASAPPSRRPSSCGWRGPSRRTTTWWAPSASSWPAASASPRPRYGTARHGTVLAAAPRRNRSGPGEIPAPVSRNRARKLCRSCAGFWGQVGLFFGDGELLLLAEQCFRIKIPCSGAGARVGTQVPPRALQSESFSSVIPCLLGCFAACKICF